MSNQEESQFTYDASDGLSWIAPSLITTGLTLLRHELGDIEEVAKLCLVGLCRLAETGQTITILGDDEEMDRSLRTDVAESQRLIILVDNVGRDLVGYHTSALVIICHAK